MPGLAKLWRHSIVRSSMSSGMPASKIRASKPSAERSSASSRIGGDRRPLTTSLSCSMINAWLRASVSSLIMRSLVWLSNRVPLLMPLSRANFKMDKCPFWVSFSTALSRSQGWKKPPKLRFIRLNTDYLSLSSPHRAQISFCLEASVTRVFQCLA